VDRRIAPHARCGLQALRVSPGDGIRSPETFRGARLHLLQGNWLDARVASARWIGMFIWLEQPETAVAARATEER
jgi:hypothetical protein